MFNPQEVQNIAQHEESLWWYRGMRQVAFTLLDPLCAAKPGLRVFEGGCGTGHFAGQVHDRYGAIVYGVEFEPAATRLCGETRELRCVRSDLRAIPYSGGCFDVALLMDVLSHFPRGEEKYPLGEIHRVLRVGGHLVIRTSALNVFRSAHSKFIWEEQRFSKKRLRRAVVEAGFSVLRVTYSNFLLSPVALLKFRIWEPLMQRVPASGLRRLPSPVETTFYRALCAESWLLQKGVNLPFGQSLYLVAVKRQP